MCPLRLKYNQAALELLGLEPIISGTVLNKLSEREEELGIRFPASVREWYSLSNVQELLRTKYRNMDHPVYLDELGESEVYFRSESRNLLNENLLHILTENQGICYWAVELDSSDDPAVIVQVDPFDEGWHLYAKTFSTFTHAWMWDWWDDASMLCAQDHMLSSDDLHFLQHSFAHGPITHGWPAEVSYRFVVDSRTRLSVHNGEGQADWFLFAHTENDLMQLAQRVWHCGELAKHLYDTDEIGTKVLQRLRGLKT